MELMSINGEQVKLKIFALQINFQIPCFRGEEDHLKAAINLSCCAIQIATFPAGKIGVFFPASPTSLAGAACKFVGTVLFICGEGFACGDNLLMLKPFATQIKFPTLPCPPAENKVIDFYIKILYNDRMNIMRKCFPPRE